MRKTACTRLPGLLLAGMLALAPLPLMAAVYKCAHDGQVVYSDAPCGKNAQEIKPGVVVVPSAQPKAEAAPAEHASGAKGWLSSLGLDSKSGIIGALLFGIPLFFVVTFFLTRKSES
jgi:hypothetical protein